MPVDLQCTVESIKQMRLKHSVIQNANGDGGLAARKCGVDVVLTSKRTQVFHPDGMTCLGIDPGLIRNCC